MSSVQTDPEPALKRSPIHKGPHSLLQSFSNSSKATATASSLKLKLSQAHTATATAPLFLSLTRTHRRISTTLRSLLRATILRAGRNSSLSTTAMAPQSAQQVPQVQEPPQTQTQNATFAAGCFWSVELAYQRVPGVVRTAVGYTQGVTESPRTRGRLRREDGARGGRTSGVRPVAGLLRDAPGRIPGTSTTRRSTTGRGTTWGPSTGQGSITTRPSRRQPPGLPSALCRRRIPSRFILRSSLRRIFGGQKSTTSSTLPRAPLGGSSPQTRGARTPSGATAKLQTACCTQVPYHGRDARSM